MKITSTFICSGKTGVRNALLFTVILFLGLFTLSCKKDTPDSVPLGTIEANVDGTKTTFNNEATATITTSNGNVTLEIKGYKKPRSTSGTYLSLKILKTGPVTSGTYTETNAGPYRLQAEHFVDLFFGVGGSSFTYGSSSNPVRITITDMSATYVKGTFSGELRSGAAGGANNTYVKLTNGVFHVSL